MKDTVSSLTELKCFFPIYSYRYFVCSYQLQRCYKEIQLIVFTRMHVMLLNGKRIMTKYDQYFCGTSMIC